MQKSLCWSHYAEVIMLKSLCWSHYAEVIILKSLCWSHYAEVIMLKSLCWSHYAEVIMLKSLCWSHHAHYAECHYAKCRGATVLPTNRLAYLQNCNLFKKSFIAFSPDRSLVETLFSTLLKIPEFSQTSWFCCYWISWYKSNKLERLLLKYIFSLIRYLPYPSFNVRVGS